MDDFIKEATYYMERGIIFACTGSAIPLFLMDQKTALGSRSYAWIGAFICSMYNHVILVEPTAENIAMWTMVDRFLLSMICVPLVPHIMQVIKEQDWFAYASLPPFAFVVYLSQMTSYESERYWQIRSFLFMSIFMLPFVNHVGNPSPPVEPQEQQVAPSSEDAQKIESKAEVPTEQTKGLSASQKRMNRKKL